MKNIADAINDGNSKLGAFGSAVKNVDSAKITSNYRNHHYHVRYPI